MAARPMSCGVPKQFNGVRPRIFFFRAGSPSNALRIMSESIQSGAMAFTRTPQGETSVASERTRPRYADFAAAAGRKARRCRDVYARLKRHAAIRGHPDAQVRGDGDVQGVVGIRRAQTAGWRPKWPAARHSVCPPHPPKLHRLKVPEQLRAKPAESIWIPSCPAFQFAGFVGRDAPGVAGLMSVMRLWGLVFADS